jgi:transcription elongation factor GreB
VTAPRKSNYITPEGFEALRNELDHLWRVERPQVTHQVSVAAALGDRSENADYIYGKKRLREIDRRVRFLRKRIDELVVVQPDARLQAGKVYFGAWVELEDEAGERVTYRVVGPDEFDARRGFISMDSPVGGALLGRKAGDEFEVVRPKGVTSYTVIEISYAAAAPGDQDGPPGPEDRE